MTGHQSLTTVTPDGVETSTTNRGKFPCGALELVNECTAQPSAMQFQALVWRANGNTTYGFTEASCSVTDGPIDGSAKTPLPA